jgi:hypothetical protein
VIAVINWATEHSFSYLEVVVLVIVVTSLTSWPLWAVLLVIAGATMLTVFAEDLLRRAVHLPSSRRVKT